MIIDASVNLKANVLKVSHHAAILPSQMKVLNVVQPEYALISVGRGNEYGLPHDIVMAQLKAPNCNIRRTDELRSRKVMEIS